MEAGGAGCFFGKREKQPEKRVKERKRRERARFFIGFLTRRIIAKIRKKPRKRWEKIL